MFMRSRNMNMSKAHKHGFVIRASHEHNNAANALYQYILQSTGSPDVVILLRHAHKLFQSIVCFKITTTNKISGPIDQLLFLINLRSDGTFNDANKIVSHCVMLQHIFYCIVAHIARLQVFNFEEYQAYTNGVSWFLK